MKSDKTVSILVMSLITCVISINMAMAADYQMGIFPYLPPTKLQEMFNPIASDFSAKLGKSVHISSRPDFASFVDGLAKEQYDIAFIQPFDYVNAHDKHKYLPLAGRGEPLKLIIIVKQDSPVKKLSDLKGKILANPPEDAAVSRLTSKALKDSGINPKTGVKRDYGKSHFSCAQSVLIGNADACGTAPQALRHFEKEKQLASHFRIIHESAPFPNSMFIVHKRIPQKEREILLKTIIGWPTTTEGKKILEIGQFTPFVATKDRDYAQVRNFLKAGF